MIMQTDNFSIIHGVDGTCFQRHYINTNLQDDWFVSLSLAFIFKLSSTNYYNHFIICTYICPCSFVLSRAHRYRLQCYYTQQGFLLYHLSFN